MGGGREELPTSEVRGGSPECQAATAQERSHGATPCLRSGAAAGKRYTTCEVRGGGQEELTQVRDQERQPGGVTPRSRSSGAWVQEGREELLHVQGQEGRH